MRPLQYTKRFLGDKGARKKLRVIAGYGLFVEHKNCTCGAKSGQVMTAPVAPSYLVSNEPLIPVTGWISRCCNLELDRRVCTVLHKRCSRVPLTITLGAA
jgi:hypothetical protein